MNKSEEPVRVLIVSEMNAPEVNFYPDSGKVLAGTRAPGGDEGPEDIFTTFRLEQGVEYWEGEQ